MTRFVSPVARPLAVRVALPVTVARRRGPVDSGPPVALATEIGLFLVTEDGRLLIPEPTEEAPA